MQACLTSSNIIARRECSDSILSAVTAPDSATLLSLAMLAALAILAAIAARFL